MPFVYVSVVDPRFPIRVADFWRGSFSEFVHVKMRLLDPPLCINVFVQKNMSS